MRDEIDAKTPAGQPAFRFHPCAYTDCTFKKEQAVCDICGEPTEYVYEGPIYCKGDDPVLCPKCISNGRAAEECGAEFIDGISGGAAVPDDLKREVRLRTPGYTAWQEVQWMSHCSYPCAFVGYVGWDEIKDKLDDFVDLEADLADSDFGYTVDDLPDALYKGGELQGYLFQCVKCGKYRLYVDCA
jgi:uncharacterized protein CbrC (UPF0167 family)